MPIPDHTRNARWDELDTLEERAGVNVKTDAGEAPLGEFWRTSKVDAHTIAGSTATIDATWHGRLAQFTGACTVTVPAGLPVGFSCGWSQEGAGAITFVAGPGATLQSLYGLLESAGQYADGGLYAVPQAGEHSASVYRLMGGLA